MIYQTKSASDYVFRGQYDQVIRVLSADFEDNEYIRSTDTADAMHHRRSPVLHPSKSYLMENRNGNFLLTGGWKFEFDWDSGDFTEAEVDDWLTNYPMGSNWTVTKDMANNRVTMTCPDTNYEMSDWTSKPPEYSLTAANRKMTCTSQGQLLCLTIINNKYTEYTIEVRTIEPNATLTVTKEGTKCYMIPSAQCLTPNTELTALQTYELSSSSVDITNDSATRMKVIRIYK